MPILKIKIIFNSSSLKVRTQAAGGSKDKENVTKPSSNTASIMGIKERNVAHQLKLVIDDQQIFLFNYPKMFRNL